MQASTTSGGCALNVFMAVAMALAAPGATLAAGSWTTEVADGSANTVGSFNAMKLDAAGVPHVAYSDQTAGTIRYASRSGGVWTSEVIGPANWEASIALDVLGNPHVAYGNGIGAGTAFLTYATRSGGIWMTEVADPSGMGYDYASIALDGSGNPGIAHRGNGLHFSFKSGGTWTTELVDGSSSAAGHHCHLRFDDSGDPHIAYVNSLTNSLHYASESGGVWTLELVDTSASTLDLVGAGLAIDASGDPHIAYTDQTGAPDLGLKYAHKSGGVWTTEVAIPGAPFSSPSIVLDSTGDPHVAYANQYATGTWHAWKSGGVWSVELVDNNPDRRSCSMDIDANDDAHITYHDTLLGDLWYATQASAPCSPPSVAFEDIATGDLQTVPSNALGVAWADFDNDGDPDFVAQTDPTLYRNDGSGTFSDVTAAALGSFPGDWFGWSASWGDYDNDGDPDLYLSGNNPNRLYRNEADGTFTDVTLAPLDDAGQGRTACWVDYDVDGDLDLFVGSAGSGGSRLFRNDGGSGFADETAQVPVSSALSGGAAWADYDDDGDPDLYLSSGQAQGGRLVRNNGDGTFTNVTTSSGDINFVKSWAPDWGDYDNDGDLDLYLAVASTNANKLFRNDGGTFTNVTTAPLSGTGVHTVGAWGDTDNDGDLDIYLVDNTGANQLLRNDGGTFADATAAPLDDAGMGWSTAWADLDGDGDIDFYLANGSGAKRLYRNDLGTGNSWLHVTLAGVSSNRSAIGARVRTVAGSLRQMREINGGFGFGSENSMTVEFGLGCEAIVDTLEIHWPAGGTDIYTALAVDSVYTFFEQTPTTAVPGAPAVHAITTRLLAAHPNPFLGSTTVAYELGALGPVHLDIFDVAGRHVRTLATGTLGSRGVHRVVWDGSSDAGGLVSAGVYFVRLRSDRTFDTRRVTVLR